MAAYARARAIGSSPSTVPVMPLRSPLNGTRTLILIIQQLPQSMKTTTVMMPPAHPPEDSSGSHAPGRTE